MMTVEVPFQQDGNALYLTAQQVAEEPWLMEFIERYRDCFRLDECRDVWWFTP